MQINRKTLETLRTLASCAAFSYGRMDFHHEIEIPAELRVTTAEYTRAVSELELALIQEDAA